MFCNYNFKNLVLHLQSVFIYNLFSYLPYFAILTVSLISPHITNKSFAFY